MPPGWGSSSAWRYPARTPRRHGPPWVDEMCPRLLCNGVIEEYRFELRAKRQEGALRRKGVRLSGSPSSRAPGVTATAPMPWNWRVGRQCARLWHADRDLKGADVVVLPGGFAYGDYLRCGAIARFAPLMEAVREHALAGGPVLGICNGFQILCEAGLPPRRPAAQLQPLQFRCQPTWLRVETSERRPSSGNAGKARSAAGLAGLAW